MVRFDRRVYGPGPLRSTPGSRVLLAVPGVDYTEAQAAAIRAAAIDVDAPVAPRPVPAAAAPQEPVRDEHGLINRGNGWYELPDGERVRGRDKAIAAAAALTGPSEAEDPPAGDVGADQEPDEDGLRALGGDWWELPSGERVHGRDAAEDALLAALEDEA